MLHFIINWWPWLLAAAYLIGAVLTFLFFMRLNGLISPGLALLRAVVWPVFWTTGWPAGARLPMD